MPLGVCCIITGEIFKLPKINSSHLVIYWLNFRNNLVKFLIDEYKAKNVDIKDWAGSINGNWETINRIAN